MKLYRRLKKILGGFLGAVLRIHSYGKENEPQEGGVIVCANHTSFLDVIVLGVALRRPVRFLAKAELFKIPVLRGLIKALGAYSVDRGGGDVAAIKKTISLISEGESVGIFPQGHRHKNVHPENTPLHHGVGMIEYRAGVNVLPVFIKTKKYRMRLFGRKDVYIGPVISHDEFAFEGGNTAEYKRATQLIFDRILSLEPKEENK
ncbi:MAG: 1-acyl-sn-glycerol-3-phosphate acyltransferase [Clostridia bacterium]|nr:1-acyl-sn-glycerol-3-phosphate acyltransferase [Clostridia bacterium]